MRSAFGVLILMALLVGCQSASVRDDNAAFEKQARAQIKEDADYPAKDAAQTSDMPPLPVDGPPDWKIGDRWLWSDGYGLEVTDLENRTTLMKRTDAADQWQRREGLFVVESRDKSTQRRVVFRSDDPMKLYPLALGKQVVFKREYLANGQLRVHRTSWVVDGRERITVPAGEFDCWVITRRTRSLQSNWTGFERMWFSPRAKQYVRLEYRYGQAPASSRVLMAYRLMP